MSLIAKLRAQRQSWVDIAPGLRVQIIRPPETEITAFLKAPDPTGGWIVAADVTHVTRYVTGWDGFTEATLLGAAVGASDPLAFDAALWAELVADHAQWCHAVGDALIAAIVKHSEQKAQATKN